MRDKLNSNPIAQLALVGVLLFAVAFLFMTRMGGGEEGEAESTPTTEATVSVAGTGASGSATGSTPGEAVEGATEAALEAATAEGASNSAVSAAAVNAPPLPAPVQAAYESGETVVLLVVDKAGIDDRLVTRSVSRLAALGDVSTFIVPASQIARYAAITLGTEVERVPALVVVTPKSAGHEIPTASIAYGFQSPESVAQAVIDARYEGPTVAYHP